jgi:cytidylate kinase
VWPQAELKVFLTASPQARAARRAAQTGEDVATVLAQQNVRDARDTSREHSPLVAAADAVPVDTTELTLEQVVDQIAQLAAGRG